MSIIMSFPFKLVCCSVKTVHEWSLPIVALRKKAVTTNPYAQLPFLPFAHGSREWFNGSTPL